MRSHKCEKKLLPFFEFKSLKDMKEWNKMK